MKKVFLATSFSHQLDPATGEVVPEFRSFIEQLLKGLRETEDLEVFCALEYEGWRQGIQPPEIGVLKDLEEVDRADVVVCLTHDRPSAGVQFELGYAVAKGKQVIIAATTEGQLAYYNQGVVSSGLVTLLQYEAAVTLLPQLAVAINAPKV